jgi:hypothetical protein
VNGPMFVAGKMRNTGFPSLARTHPERVDLLLPAWRLRQPLARNRFTRVPVTNHRFASLGGVVDFHPPDLNTGYVHQQQGHNHDAEDRNGRRDRIRIGDQQ